MRIEEARELRAAIGEALDPLYAARAWTIPALAGVQAAIAVLHRVDRALLAVVNGAGTPARFTTEERAWVLDSIVASQALAGIPVTLDQADRTLDALEGRPLPDIGGEG